MSYGFCTLYSIQDEKTNTFSLINKNSKIPIGNDRIYKLHEEESFNDYTNSFCKSESTKSSQSDKQTNTNSIFEMKMPYVCIFCGGENCKYENPLNHKNTAIPGLIADLYYDCIYASQRPSTCLIKKYNLIETFKLKKIKLIVNCQINGEHPYCGPNNGLEEDCGYSYSPSVFISQGIDVLCKGFQDMTPPDTLDFMLEIVKKMAYVIKYKKGRVLVHCHAGNGRTGLVNACFFIYYFNKSYKEAIKEIRKLRIKGLEKTSQEIYCQKFSELVKKMKDLFPNKRQKVEIFIKNQKNLDFNFDKDKYIIPSIIVSYYFKDNKYNNKELFKKIIDIDFIPKIIFKCIEKIVEIKILNNISLKELYLVLNGMNELKDNDFKEIRKIKMNLKINNWESFKMENDISIISELFFIWLNDYVYNCIDPQKIEQIIDQFISMLLPKHQNQSLPESNMNNNYNNKDINLLNNIQNLFDLYIDNNDYKLNNSEIYKKMLNIIKYELNKVEYETIKFISLFLQIIYPTNKFNNDAVEINISSNIDINSKNNMLIFEYKRLLYKLSLFLLGYNLDKVNLTPNKFLKSKELLYAKMLIFIFELFILFNDNNFSVNDIINETDNQENYDVFFRYKNNSDFKNIKLFL